MRQISAKASLGKKNKHLFETRKAGIGYWSFFLFFTFNKNKTKQKTRKRMLHVTCFYLPNPPSGNLLWPTKQSWIFEDLVNNTENSHFCNDFMLAWVKVQQRHCPILGETGQETHQELIMESPAQLTVLRATAPGHSELRGSQAEFHKPL